MRTASIVATVSALAALSPAAFPHSAAAQAPPPLKAGTHAPALHTKTLSGKPIDLKQLRGKVVLIDIWATWCGPCRMIAPTLQALHSRYSKQGLQVIGLSVDEGATLPAVPQFAKYYGLTYTISASPEQNSAIQRRYNGAGLPAQYLIDKKGIVRWSQLGVSYNEPRELDAKIKKLLAEKA